MPHPRLKVIARAGVDALDNIDVGAADDAGVVVVAPLGANAVSVAEHAVTMALALSKGLISADHSTRAGTWGRTPTKNSAGVGGDCFRRERPREPLLGLPAGSV